MQLADDPVAHVWQLAAIAPLGPLDQMQLLRSATMSELLDGIMEHTLGVELTLASSWTEDDPDDGDFPAP